MAAGERIELVVVRGKDAARPEAMGWRGGQMLRHGPSNREAIEGGRAAANFIEQHQRALTGVLKDVRRFGHLHHEGGLATGEIIHGANAGEDSIGQTDGGTLSGNPAAHLRHQLQHPALTQITALAAGVGAGEHHQIWLVAIA